MGFSSAAMSVVRNNRRLVKSVSRKFTVKNDTINTIVIETDKLKPEILQKANKKRIIKTLGYFLPILLITTILLVIGFRAMM